ncbi:MAG: ATP-binding protein [Desulfuromonas sp.]|nr:MAG: ATP-binding protein [Desulfuromonas sp.]
MTDPTRSEQHEHKARIWAVGGGKGGVGKSVVTTSMAIALARRGERCILVDADLGGANLHTFVGMNNPERTLTDLFRKDVAGLKDILLSTRFPNLWLISGARALLDMANPAYQQKMKVIRQIFSLHADHIFIDLGAGSSYNVLDFFLAAHEGVMVVVPTPTSVENAYHFLKAVYYRRLKKVVRKLGAEKLVDNLLAEKVQRGIRSPRDLVRDIQSNSREIGLALAEQMAELRPRLIINQVKRGEDLTLGTKISAACRDFFAIDVDMAGNIRTDERVLASLKARRPTLDMFPSSPFADDLERVVRTICPVTELTNGRDAYAEL